MAPRRRTTRRVDRVGGRGLDAPGARVGMTGTAIRRIVIQQSKRANVGHIGSALSVADIVAALYGGVLRLPAHDAPDRDRFVLGKGHSVLAVYAAMFLRGTLGQTEIDSYCADGSLLGVHPAREL